MSFGWISGDGRWSSRFRVDFGCTSDGLRAVFDVFVEYSGNVRADFGLISVKFRAYFGQHLWSWYGMIRDIWDDPSQHAVST